MHDLPNKHPTWMEIADLDELHEVPLQLARDPYFLEDVLLTPTNLLEEEDSLEDKRDDDLEEVVDYDDEEIL